MIERPDVMRTHLRSSRPKRTARNACTKASMSEIVYHLHNKFIAERAENTQD